jgi:GntR family transcriptional regulator, transcriptional repressor for pyruvate dehydrogenase complex
MVKQMFEPIKRVTVTEQVMEKIAELITSGKLKPGEKLPTERDLAEQFQVTRGRVREALRALSLIGLITIKAGEGSFVNHQENPIPADTIVWLFHNERHNIEEVYAARKLIETEVYMTAAVFAEKAGIEKLNEHIQSLRKILKAGGNLELFAAQLDEFDLFMGEICGNQIYAKLMQTIVHLRRETSNKILKVPGSMESSLKSREQIVECILKNNIDQLKQAIEISFSKAKKFYESIISEF